MLASIQVAQGGLGRKAAQTTEQAFFAVGDAKSGGVALRTAGFYLINQFMGGGFDDLHPGGVEHGPHIGFHK